MDFILRAHSTDAISREKSNPSPMLAWGTNLKIKPIVRHYEDASGYLHSGELAPASEEGADTSSTTSPRRICNGRSPRTTMETCCLWPRTANETFRAF